jgi:hypothetical protein
MGGYLSVSKHTKRPVLLCAGVVESYHGHAGHDHPDPLLGGILGHYAYATYTLHVHNHTHTHPKVQPAALFTLTPRAMEISPF